MTTIITRWSYSTFILLVILYLSSIGPWNNLGVLGVSVKPLSAEELKSWDILEETFQYSKRTLKESSHSTFHYFENTKISQSEGEPVRGMTNLEKTLLTKARDDGAKHLADLYPGFRTEFVSGRYRWLPDGIEYDFQDHSNSTMQTKRFTAFQKFEPIRMVNSFTIKQKEVLNMIVPIKGRLSKYITFLDHLISDVLPHDQWIILTVVYFENDFKNSAEQLTREKLSTFPNFNWTIVPVNHTEFSRGYGLHVGIEHAKKEQNSQLIFFCDVDIRLHPEFFARCRNSSKKGQQVYYPVAFSVFNSSLPAQPNVDKKAGFWRTFDFGISCMYISDYEASGGFPDISTRRDEGTQLYENFLKLKSHKVIRSPDPGIFHLHHKKGCKDKKTKTNPLCLKTNVKTKDSKLHFSPTLIKLVDDFDLEELLLERIVTYLAIVLVFSVSANLLQAIGLLQMRAYMRMQNK